MTEAWEPRDAGMRYHAGAWERVKIYKSGKQDENFQIKNRDDRK